jgi:predicted ATPase with chaperone activity
VLCMSQLNLSAQAYHRTRSVKLARTIADLEGRGNSVRALGRGAAIPAEADDGLKGGRVG